MFDIYTIIFLALAVFIFLRLRSVLGQRTGRERPPYNPYSSAHEPVRPAAENVVALPSRAPEAIAPAQAASAEPVERWKGVAEAGSTRMPPAASCRTAATISSSVASSARPPES